MLDDSTLTEKFYLEAIAKNTKAIANWLNYIAITLTFGGMYALFEYFDKA